MRLWWQAVRKAMAVGLAEYRRIRGIQKADPTPRQFEPYRFQVYADYGHDDKGLRLIHTGDSGGIARRTFETVQSVCHRVELYDGESRRGLFVRSKRH